MAKVNLSDLKKEPKKNVLKKTEERANFVKPAPGKKTTTTKGKKQLGRPQKDESERLSEKVTVNFTKSEHEKLKGVSKKRFDMALPKLIRLLLKESGNI